MTSSLNDASDSGMLSPLNAESRLADWTQTLVDWTSTSRITAAYDGESAHDNTDNLSINIAIGSQVFVKVYVGAKQLNAYKTLVGSDAYATVEANNNQREGYHQIDDEDFIDENHDNGDEKLESRKCIYLTGTIVTCNWRNDKVSFQNHFILFLWQILWSKSPFKNNLIRHNCAINCSILYYTILYYTILYYTILYYTVLYYTIFFHNF